MNTSDIDWPFYSLVILFSAVGFVYFFYGKKMSQFWFMAAGLGLTFFGYFFDSWLAVLGVGIGLSALPFLTNITITRE